MSFDIINSKFELDSKTYVNYTYLNQLIKRRNTQLDGINTIYDGIDKIYNKKDFDIIKSIIKTNEHLSSLTTFYSREDAILNNDCIYWDEFLNNSKLREIMDYNTYQELLNRFKTRNKENHIPFDKEHIYSFIDTILMNRHTIFATKLHNALLQLDKGYKSNQGNRLNGVLVFNSYSYERHLNYTKVQIIDDIRSSLRQVLNIEELNASTKTMELLKSCQGDDWCDFDYGLLKIKYFLNGNVHIHLSDLAYNTINTVLYHLNKNVLDYDTSLIKRKPYVYKGKL